MKFIFSDPFMKAWYKSGLTIADRNDLQNDFLSYVLNAPDNRQGKKFPGEIIQNTGGAIKWRFASEKSDKGKSGSYRIIYFVFEEETQTAFFLDVYGKNEKASLSNEEKHAIKIFIKSFKKAIKSKRS